MLSGVIDWPQEFVERYETRGYWRGLTLGDAFTQSVERHAERIAVVDETRRVTYAELGKLVERMSLQLVELGLCDGERVVFQLPNVLEFIVCYFACLRVGAVPVACLPTHRQAEIDFLAKHSDARGWIIPSEFRGFDFVKMAEELRPLFPKLEHVIVLGPRAGSDMLRLEALLEDPIEARRAPSTLDAHRPRSRDTAVFQLSGGTTGVPKIIPRTHEDYLYNSLEFAKASGLDGDGVMLVPVPVAHNFPLACPGIQGALLLGARVVLARSPSADTVFPLIEKERATWIPAVPATVITWVNDPRRANYDLSSLRTLCVGGHRLHAEPARAAIEAFGSVLCQVYGMAEGLLCCTRIGDSHDVITETQGRPISVDDEIRIVDDEGREVAKGELGELHVRGPYTIRGYFRADEYNRTAFTADGFYRTGDLVREHPSGNYIVEGRSKDVINRGGEKIGAEDVENAILTHPAVQNVAVVGMPDPVLGERACAFVVLKTGAALTLPELGVFLKARMAAFKVPERLEIRETLPLTSIGKISKKLLREELREMMSVR